MNDAKAKAALHDLAVNARSLELWLNAEAAQEHAPVWRNVAHWAESLLNDWSNISYIREQIAGLVEDVAREFGHRPGGFMEVYSPDAVKNTQLEKLRDGVADAAGRLRGAVEEGEVNPGDGGRPRQYARG